MSASTPNVQNLSKTVGSAEGRLAIPHDLSLDPAHGDNLATVGSSGSGKSTLLSLLVGLDQPSGDEVRLAGHALGDPDKNQRTRIRVAHAGFAFQSFQLLDNLDALENVVLSLELESRADAHQCAKEPLERASLGQRLGHHPHQLPGGEQQQVAIARTFAMEPNVLLADELIGNLDNVTGERVSNLLFELGRERGTTLIPVIHDGHLAHHCRCLARLEGERLTDRVEP